MTLTARKSLTKKIVLLIAIALSVFVLALQFVSVPVLSTRNAVSPDQDSDEMNGVSANYLPAGNNLDGLAVTREDLISSDGNANRRLPKVNDTVSVIVTLEGTPMMKYATEHNLTVAQAFETVGGKDNYEKLNSVRESALVGISKYLKETRYNYTTVINAFSADVRYGDIANIESNPYVKQVILSDTYEAPKAVTENHVNVYETGIFDSSDVGYDGTGTVVAVVDTGTDYTHEVFDMELDPEKVAMTKDDVAAVVPLLTATSQSQAKGDSIDEDDLYLKTKLPFKYDYADSDINVYPSSSHGTHVAGIIAGKSDKITGVAPGAQIATFKVFSDYRSGASTEWILAALNDCVVLGVDAINMSLGTSCGFSREVDEEGINEIYDAINDAGICLVVAASNDASSAQASTWGNTNLASNPDSGTVGSPGSYTASLTVASVSGVKTRYFMVEDKEVYFAESRLVGKTDSNDFVNELLGDKEEGEYEFVVIPGIGLQVNYTGLDVKGKIAVIKRGNNSFEDKVRIARDNGAIAAIVYNNISGTISMSVGTVKTIPSCFVTMDLAAPLVELGTGTVKISKSYLAGPFMSDFSSWGCLPDLTLAPDITAHGGEIYSAVAGGNMYDKMSGTSMASPNMAGALILVRQYVKENHPEYTTSQIRDESYSRMMSTATIVKNEQGNPYSPRKQGAGIADIANSVNTKAYLTVDGSNKPKLSLGDDPSRSGEYTLNFNLVNTSQNAVSYSLGAYVMTESMSSDNITVAEKAYMFDDTTNSYSVKATKGNAVLNGNSVTVSGYGEAAITVKIQLSAADKAYLNKLFKNGMFVEGYVRLNSANLDGINLNMPFLAFYGDWSDAPMLDVSAYDVGASEADDSILEEDKLVADVYGTIPMAGFYSATSVDQTSYWGMGSFVFIPATGYEAPPAQEKYASLTTNPDGNYLFYGISAGLLRGAKRVEMEIRNSATGELIWSGTDYNARKTHSSGGDQTGGYVIAELNITELNLPNNSKYTFSMECFLDWKDEDGNYTYGNNNKFSFEFTVDNENPELADYAVRKVKNGDSYRYYLDLTTYDNHYIQGYSASTYKEYTSAEDSSTGYESFDGVTNLVDGVVPVESEYNKNSTFSLDITSYWSKIVENDYKLYVTLYDYAKNGSSFRIKLQPENDLRIAKTRNASNVYILAPNRQVDLSEVVNVTANTFDNVEESEKIYVSDYWTTDLIWKSSNTEAVEVDEKTGLVTALKDGEATVTVYTQSAGEVYDDSNGQSLQFTVRVSGEPTEIKLIGIEMSTDGLMLERGETATITATVKPYNYDSDYNIEFASTSANVKILRQYKLNDVYACEIYAVNSGSATIRATVEGSRISGYTSVRVQEEFGMYNNIYLRSYTGRGDENGHVEIPDNLGIVYIYPGAFANNEYIKSVTIPEGVTTIMRAAFFNCRNLERVVLPSTVETLEEIAFANDNSLVDINLGNVKMIGDSALWGASFTSVDLSSCTYIDKNAFTFCRSLTTVDLSRVGIVGSGAFALSGLTTLRIPANTSMEYEQNLRELANNGGKVDIGGAFAGCTSLQTLIIDAANVGKLAFLGCSSLRSVTFMNDVNVIGEAAFVGCTSLSQVTFNGSVYEIAQEAFAECTSLRSITLPKGLSVIGSAVFGGCTISEIKISSGARFENVDMGAFVDCSRLTSFVVEDGNEFLCSKDGVLYDRAMTKLIAYPTLRANESFTVPGSVKTIGRSAFSFVSLLRSIDLNNVEYIEEWAFAGVNSASDNPRILNINNSDNVKYIGAYAFYNACISNIPVSDKTTYIGDYSFAGSDISGSNISFAVGANLAYLGDYAFADTALTGVSFANSKADYIGNGVFADCVNLGTVELGSLSSLGNEMFAGCTSLSSIVIPNTVETLGASVFEDCENLTTVTLSSSLKSIAPAAFAGTAISGDVVLPESVTDIGAYAYMDTGIVSVNLANIKSIGNDAFSGTKLTSVESDSVNYIGNGAFMNNSELKTVKFDNALTVGDRAFENNPVLESVTLGNAKTIGSNAFAYDTSLKSISLDNAEKIGVGAFYGDTLLQSVSLNNAVSIGNFAFANTAIKSFTLSASVSKIDDRAFYGAQELAEINVADGNKKYVGLDGVLYYINENGFYTLVSYPSGKTDKAYTVYEKTIRLGAYSMCTNKYVESLTLPVYLQVIGVSAMSGMSALKEITFNSADAPTLESEAVITYAQPGEDYNEGDRLDIESFINRYDNFNFAFDADEKPEVTFITPSNASGYDNRIWKLYVGKVTNNNTIQANISTLEYIERIKALPDNPTRDDQAEVDALLRMYNILSSVQQHFIKGDYSYSASGNTIDDTYYTAILGGIDYYNRLTEIDAKIKALPDPAVEPTPTDNGGLAGWAIALIVIACVLVVAGVAVAVVFVVLKKKKGAAKDEKQN